jgi:hypothetical protein
LEAHGLTWFKRLLGFIGWPDFSGSSYFPVSEVR